MGETRAVGGFYFPAEVAQQRRVIDEKIVQTSASAADRYALIARQAGDIPGAQFYLLLVRLKGSTTRQNQVSASAKETF